MGKTSSVEQKKRYHRTYYEKNKERLSEAGKKWYQDNIEYARAYRRDYYQRNKERSKERSTKHHLKKTYGITVEEKDWLFAAQGFKCASCSSPEPGCKQGWHVDHCHETGTVRSILCNACNVSLGLMGEDAVRIRALADYIEKHKTK